MIQYGYEEERDFATVSTFQGEFGYTAGPVRNRTYPIIGNKSACHGCHKPASKTNSISCFLCRIAIHVDCVYSYEQGLVCEDCFKTD